MTLAAGTRLGPYEITAKLGEGGMGEVYRATDTKLKREVAIKVLPAEFTADKERLARFEREAQLLAQLNHPNIAAIHGLEESEGVRALVMELVEGPTLAERLEHGPLPFNESLSISLQIAQALEEAHEKGIVHRDLKPQNVKASMEGKVKVLDFGLAKAMDPAGAPGSGTGSMSQMAKSPTLTLGATQLGVILGTAAYMSPEQAKGASVDKRADIWAFGVVLYEMLSGKRLFDAPTVPETLAQVLTRAPDLAELPRETPPALRELLRRCLERDPKSRLRDIGEARVLLSGGLSPAPATATRAEGAARAGFGARLPWILFAVAAAGVAVLLLSRGSSNSFVRPIVRKFAIETHVESGTYGNARWVEISPDGSRLVFQSERGLEVRELRSLESRLLVPASDLANGANGAAAFWSPDGESIAYAALGSLRRVAVAGGAPTTISNLAGEENGGVWMADDTIVYTTTRGPMYRVRAGGGDPELILSPDPKEELDFHQPSALPDGRSLVYPVHRLRGVDTIEMLRDGKRSVVLRVDPGPINLQDSPQIVNVPFYSPTGHLLYQRDQGNVGLWALPFSLEKGIATGEPFLVAPGMENGSVANDGTLVYSGKAGSVSAQLTLVSRDGKLERTLGEALPNLRVGTFSADGRRLLYEAAERQASDLYVWNFDGDRAERLTNTPEPENEPVWIPGSGRIAFSAPTENCRGVFGINADGTGARELLVERASEPWFAPGGSELVYSSTCQKSHGLSRFVIAQKSSSALLDAAAGIDSAALSPDGRYLAYRSWEGGKAKLYITRYPSLDGRWLVAEAESVLRWARNGSEVYYFSPSPDRMIAAPVRLDPVFSLGEAKPLFELAALGVPRQSRFDISPDGKRFAMIREAAPSENQGKIVVVENWFEEFRKP